MPRPKLDDDKLATLYAAGATLKVLAVQFNTTPATIAAHLRRVGCQIRRSGPRRTTGKWVGIQGYIEFYAPADWPYREMLDKAGTTKEHRAVMAEHLGRPLTRSETVHHVNGDITDNRIENLQIRRGRHGNGVRLACQDCGSHNIIEVPLADEVD